MIEKDKDLEDKIIQSISSDLNEAIRVKLKQERSAKSSEAYQKAFPNTKSVDHAERRSTLLLKNKTVRQAVDKEIENLMSEVGITKRYLLESTKDVVDKADAKDNDKLRALETLMKISGLLSTEKKVDSVALIQEFSGFSRDKLKAFEQGILPETKKEISG